jgi:xylulokinase
MDLNYHVVPGWWVVSQFLGGLGACMAWWVKQCGQKVATGHRQVNDTAGGRNTRCCAPTEWEEFDAAVAGTVPGCGGLIYLPQTGVRRAGQWGADQHGGFVGLRLDHSSADMGRAIMEGAAYALRWALDDLQEAGLPMKQMWMIGGATQSPLWPIIVADVSGVPVLLSQYRHGPALGAAMLAGLGLGIFDSVESAQAHFRVAARRLEPEEAHAAVYERQFSAYRRLAKALL